MTWDLRDKEASSTSSSETIEWASRSTRRRRGARGFGSARSSCSSPPSFGTKPEPKTRDEHLQRLSAVRDIASNPRGTAMKHVRRSRRARPWARPLVSLVAWGLLVQGAAAQSLPEDLTQLPIEQLMAIDLVYGASKHEQKVTDAPSFVSVVTADDIRRYGYRTLADVLRSVHGFYTTYDRNYTYLGVRGFSRPSDYNSRFLLLVDGHRINDNVYGRAYTGTEEGIDVDLIDRVEIIRGPSSSLYGTSAFFAVINVITLKQTDFPRLQLSRSEERRVGKE